MCSLSATGVNITGCRKLYCTSYVGLLAKKASHVKIMEPVDTGADIM